MGAPDVQYKNLKAEMGRNDVFIKDIAQELDCNRDTVGCKLSRKRSLTLCEAFKIQKKFFPSCSIPYLFAEDDFK